MIQAITTIIMTAMVCFTIVMIAYIFKLGGKR